MSTMLASLSRRLAHAFRRSWRALVTYLARMPGTTALTLQFYGWALAFCVACSSACSSLTATEGAALEAANAIACTGLSLIPVVGGAIAAACPAEESLVKGAVEHAMATPDAGADAGERTATATAAMVAAKPVTLGAPLTRRHGRHRRHVGHTPAGFSSAQVAVAQAWIDGQADGVSK